MWTTELSLGEVVFNNIQLPSQAVGIVRTTKSIIAGCMDSTMYCYSTKGKRLWSVRLPAPITTMDSMFYRMKNWKGVVLALRNGEVRVYSEKSLGSSIKLGGVTATIVSFLFSRCFQLGM
eukprot:m.543976 g.543976  ORF g.543976 m.543976 type:complete len:120 (-) comp57669_c1_seq6:773-1132(-)